MDKIPTPTRVEGDLPANAAWRNGDTANIESDTADPGGRTSRLHAEPREGAPREVSSSEAPGGLLRRGDHPEAALAVDRDERTGGTDLQARPAVSPERRLAGRAVAADERVTSLEAASNISESLGLGYHLGSAIERIVVGASEGSQGVSSLREATWLIERYISLVQQRPIGADLQVTSLRLNHSNELIDELKALSAALDAQTAAEEARRTVVGADSHGIPKSANREAQEGSASDPSEEALTEDTSPQKSLGHEIILMLVRWSIIALAVIVVVLAVTLIGGR